MSCSGQSDKEWSLRKKVLPLRYFHLLGELLVRRMPFWTLTLTTMFIPKWKDALTSECTGLTCPRAPSGRLLSLWRTSLQQPVWLFCLLFYWTLDYRGSLQDSRMKELYWWADPVIFCRLSWSPSIFLALISLWLSQIPNEAINT